VSGEVFSLEKLNIEAHKQSVSKGVDGLIQAFHENKADDGTLELMTMWAMSIKSCISYWYSKANPALAYLRNPPPFTPELRQPFTEDFLTPERYASIEQCCMDALDSDNPDLRMAAMQMLAKGLASAKGKKKIAETYAACLEGTGENAARPRTMKEVLTLAESLAYLHDAAGVETFWKVLDGGEAPLYARAVEALSELNLFYSDPRVVAVLQSDNPAKAVCAFEKFSLSKHPDATIVQLRRLRESHAANAGLDASQLSLLGKISDKVGFYFDSIPEAKQKVIADDIRFFARLPDAGIRANVAMIFVRVVDAVPDERDTALISAMLRQDPVNDGIRSALLNMLAFSQKKMIRTQKDVLFELAKHGDITVQFKVVELLRMGLGEEPLTQHLWDKELEKEFARLSELYAQ